MFSQQTTLDARVCVIDSKPLTHPRGYTCSRACAVKRWNWFRRATRAALGKRVRLCLECGGPIAPELRKGTMYCTPLHNRRRVARMTWRRKHWGHE